jgi:hypothetical protein
MPFAQPMRVFNYQLLGCIGKIEFGIKISHTVHIARERHQHDEHCGRRDDRGIADPKLAGGNHDVSIQ